MQELHRAINPSPNAEAVTGGLDMHIARGRLDGTAEDLLDESDDRRVPNERLELGRVPGDRITGTIDKSLCRIEKTLERPVVEQLAVQMLYDLVPVVAAKLRRLSKMRCVVFLDSR